MAASPGFKVYSKNNEYLAACHYVQDAAAIVAARGDGTTIRFGHSKTQTLWTEGSEKTQAGESFDTVYSVCAERMKALGYWRGLS